MIDLQSEILANMPNSKLANELKLIGRCHNMQGILNEWMQGHGYFIALYYNYHVFHQDADGNQEHFGHFTLYEDALKFVIERIAPVENKANPAVHVTA